MKPAFLLIVCLIGLPPDSDTSAETEGDPTDTAEPTVRSTAIDRAPEDDDSGRETDAYGEINPDDE
jgi:hypothetical protein